MEPCSLPLCRLRAKSSATAAATHLRQQRPRRSLLARAAAETVTTAEDASVKQQAEGVPPHILRRLEALQQEVQQAYQAGYKAGYTAGVKVQVNVDVEFNSGRQQRQSTNGASSHSSSSSFSSNGQQHPQATAAAANQPAPAPAVPGDSLVRSAVKGLIWRLFSTTATMGIALLVLHDILKVEDALKIGALEFIAKFVLYFVHERMWAAIKL